MPNLNVKRDQRGAVVIDVEVTLRSIARTPRSDGRERWVGGNNADLHAELTPFQAVALLKALMEQQELRIAAGFGEADEVAHVATNGLAR